MKAVGFLFKTFAQVAFVSSVTLAGPTSLLVPTTSPLTWSISEQWNWSSVNVSPTGPCPVGLAVNGSYTGTAGGTHTSLYTSATVSSRTGVGGCTQIVFENKQTFIPATINSIRGTDNELRLISSAGTGVSISDVSTPGPSASTSITYQGFIDLQRAVKRIILIGKPDDPTAECIDGFGPDAHALPQYGTEPLASAETSIIIDRLNGVLWERVMKQGAVVSANYNNPNDDVAILSTLVIDDASVLGAGTLRITIAHAGVANRAGAAGASGRESVNSTMRIRFEECLADWNGDQIVDGADYFEFINAFGTPDCEADFNYDGVVDFFDYLDFMAEYGAGC